MSLSFWINLAICVFGVRGAWLDHGETYAAFKSLTGREKRKKGEKLFFLWGVPILSMALLPVTWSSDRETTALAHATMATSNQMYSATQQLAAVETRTRPKPFKERLKTFLDSKDKAILIELANGVIRFEPVVSEYDLGKLEEFCTEPEGPKYIQIFPRDVSITADGASTRKVDLRLNPSLLK